MKIPKAARKLEPSLSWRPIIYCIGLNIGAAAAVFFAILISTGNPMLTVVSTFYSWLVTTTTSFGFWIWWFFERIKSDQKTKIVLVASMMLLLAIEWMIVLSCLWYLM